MKTLVRSLIIGIALAMAVMAPAAAITYGTPDAGEHPYVGFTIFYDPAEDGWFSCSGTLLDGDTFLTAGHCTYGIGTDGVLVDTSGGTDAWVTVRDTEVLAGWPLRSEIGTVYPDVAALNAARRAWLDDPANGFVGATAYPNPLYNGFADFPVNHDVGVMELDTPIALSQYGQLAPIGTVESLLDGVKNRNTVVIESVGYGIQAIQPHPTDVETRYKSTSRIVEVNGNASQGGNLHTLNNPSAVGGTGGTCFGDSGGPLFVNDTNQVIAVVSYGFSGTCHGADYSWRVDTTESYAFILPFLGS
jgi:hypothetical protein